jgi:hypothetical protein
MSFERSPIQCRKLPFILDFPRSLLDALITYTSRVSFRMNRELHRAGAGSGTLRDRRPPRSGRGASSFSDLCVKSFSSDFPAFSKKLLTLTPFFSSMPSHSFTLFFTLAEISPLAAIHTKNAWGWPLCSPPNRNYSSYPKVLSRPESGARQLRFGPIRFPPLLPQPRNSTIVAARTESENN